MIENHENLELSERLTLIESMIAEGRRGTESWGWTFVLWGVAYFIAIAWSTFGRSTWAWPVTMIAAFIVTTVVASRRTHNRPGTTLGRAISSIWVSMGISIFILLLSLGVSGRADEHTFIAIVGAMLGGANAASSIILKWKIQRACAVVWWGSAAEACFGSDRQNEIVFLAAIFFCQIGFGVYAMIADARERKQSGAVHA
jgi:hypothetical protein